MLTKLGIYLVLKVVMNKKKPQNKSVQTAFSLSNFIGEGIIRTNPGLPLLSN
jgi:hypothetical protein